MKIAIAATKNSEDSVVSQVSGRAPFWLIFEDGKLIKNIKNPFRFGGGGAGFGVAKLLEDEKVSIAIAGNFGPNMSGALDSAGIKTKQVENIKVIEALEK